MNPDYTKLYEVFGLQPDCSLDDFRQAYRRLVADVHPDRQNSMLSSGGATLALPDITALYIKAIRFHRRYGRLPGTSPIAQTPAPPPVPPSRPSDVMPVPSAQRMTTIAGRVPLAPERRYQPLLWLAIAVFILLAIGTWKPAEEVNTPPRPSHGSESLTTAPVEIPSRLELGMRKKDVVAIQGEPVRRHGDQWEYGPSWILFEHGRVSDWYSSPLYRLKTATPTPPPDDGR